MHLLNALYATSALTALTALAHPGEHHDEPTPAEIHAFNKRHLRARACDSVIERHVAQRRAVRGTQARKRSLVAERASGCVLTPEVTEGPYYIKDELVRSDLREDQAGVDITLDVQILDLATCEPLTDVFFEVWNANAYGEYSGYSEGTTSSGGLTDSGSWLRGGNVVGSNGNVTIQTKYPGHYAGRTAHMHLMVHSDYVINSNNTIASTGGSIVHIGQFFFEQDLNDEVFATAPYSESTSTLTTNDEDNLLAQVVSAGYPPYVQADYVGSTVSDGLNVYAAVVVDTSASYSVKNQNFAPTFTYSNDQSSASSASVSSSSSSPSGSSISRSSSATSAARSAASSSGSATSVIAAAVASVSEATASSAAGRTTMSIGGTAKWLGVLLLPLGLF